jgi:diguanylate cyclase (GGDEF)-like protein/PAS domain S-box-containing protein
VGEVLSGYAKFMAHPQVQALTLRHLIDYEVDPRNRDWFAGCMLKHTTSFPYIRYTLARTTLVAAAASTFLPWYLLAPVVAMGLLFALLHVLFRKSAQNPALTETQKLNRLGHLLFASSIGWSATTILCIVLAPPGVNVVLVLIAGFALMNDALTLVAMPRVAMLTSVIQACAISGPLLWLGGAANMVVAVIVPLMLICIHWGVFNFHYLMATRRLRTRELKEKNETIQLLLNQYDEEGSDWLFETDCEGRFINPSERFCRAAGLSRRELTGLRFSALMEMSDARDAYLEMVKSQQPVRDLAVPVTVGGRRHWWSLSIRPVQDEEGNAYAWRGFVADVTKAREAEDKVAYLAHYDPLTGLPNRNLFGATLAQALTRRREGERVAVIQVDLSQFKEVNEMHGHEIGDHVLIDTALALKSVVPANATVARLGGDEFAIVLEQMRDPESITRIARSIGNNLRQPVTIDGQQFQIGARIGLSVAPDNGEAMDDILRAANHALHDAKTKGRNALSSFDPAMKEQIQTRRMLEQDLRKALVKGELEVHYQALVAADSGIAVGYEALLRWRHPERGMISPVDFIPIAEENGQIIPIGAWVLREALTEAATWPEDIFISINLSPVQMKDPKLVSNIFMALSASGVCPSRVELEITESVLLTDNEENLALLHKIRDLGVKIVMDDFGTGYSSLSYLRAFPFDKIKIDRCFVTDLAEKSDSQAIVSAVIKLAEELGMCTLAEGVENIEQLDRLRRTGCEQVQGFLFSRARPSSELEHKIPGRRSMPVGGAIVTPFVKGEVDRGVKQLPAAEEQRAAG